MSHDFKCQVEEVKHENITFQVWDLAGQARRLTPRFFRGKTSEAWKICRRICVPIGLPTSRTAFPCSLIQCSVSSHYYA